MRSACFSNLLRFLLLICTPALANAQTIGTFSSVVPGPQTQNFVFPSTHTFQRIIKSGDALTAGGTLGSNLDFTGYVPIGGSSRTGYLSISSETTPAECAILTISFNNATKVWDVSGSGKVQLPVGAGSDLGNVSTFCSGTVTPDNTIMVCEETTAGGNANSSVDNYEDVGWVIEIDPVTRTVIDHNADGRADKLWAVGRQAHENVAIKSDESVIYWGADANPTGYMYKFVPVSNGVYTTGTLYVLYTTGAPGTGTWVQVLNPSSTVADRNNTVLLSAGAYNFDGIEDVEIGPDGKIYFNAKGPGRVYRFTDNGATVSNLEVFVENTTYDVNGAAAGGTVAWGLGNDNLAFDGEGNLWVLQDGGDNHIWVVGPTHTAASPQVRLFGKTPAGSEPTGITFTPDYKFMFISFQHPSSGNSSFQPDAAGANVVFNTSTTIVVARTNVLGIFSALPVKFTGFDLQTARGDMEITWSVTGIDNHSYFVIERSIDGIHFESIYKNGEVLNNSNHTFKFTDHTAPGERLVFYRIQQCELDGSCQYSQIRSAKIPGKKRYPVIYPVPASQIVNVVITSSREAVFNFSIMDGLGRIIQKEKKKVSVGMNTIPVDIKKLGKGNYIISICDDYEGWQERFIKL